MVENNLLISVISDTSVYKDLSLSINYSFYLLTSSSFYSAFFLKSTSRLFIFSSIYIFLAFKVTFYFSIYSLSWSKVVIFYWMSPKDFSMSVSILSRFFVSSSTDYFTVYCIFLTVSLIYLMESSNLYLSSRAKSLSLLAWIKKWVTSLFVGFHSLLNIFKSSWDSFQCANFGTELSLIKVYFIDNFDDKISLGLGIVLQTGDEIVDEFVIVFWIK